MSLAYKPHSVVVETASQNVVSNDVEGRTLVAGFAVGGQFTPGNAKLVYEQFNIEVDDPSLFMCDLEDADSFTIGTIVNFSDQNYVVRTVSKWNAIPDISCATVVLAKERV